MSTIDINQNQNILDKKPNPTESYQGERDKDVLKDELQKWSKGEDKEKAREIDKVVKDIVALRIPVSELETVMDTLPLAQRLEVQKIVLIEQQNMIATLGQKEYQQYLQATFPKDTSNKAGEMAQSMMKSMGEIYQQTQTEIQKMTAGESPSEIAKKEFKNDQRTAVAATQGAEQKTKEITSEVGYTA